MGSRLVRPSSSHTFSHRQARGRMARARRSGWSSCKRGRSPGPFAPRDRERVHRASRPGAQPSWPSGQGQANRDRDSACAVGLVRVEEGRIVRRAYSLIRPWTRHFEFTYLHGIAWSHVANARTFRAVWPLIAELSQGVDFIAAHNASFDEGVLHACCERAGVPALRARFECTEADRPADLRHLPDQAQHRR